jgi:hypothetical protein
MTKSPLKTLNMKWLQILFIILFFPSCDTYYYITNVEDIYLYNSPSKNDDNKDVILIPAGTYYYSTHKNKRFRKIKFKNVKGYAFNPYFDNPYYVPSIKSDSKITSSQTSTSTQTNSSSYNSTSSRPKTVNVKGYYRKDGTYVKPHTRSAPRKK